MPSLEQIRREVALPLPDDLDGPEEGRPWVWFRDGEWRCSRDGPCGALTLADAARIDVDRDGADELVIALTVNAGGTISLLRLLAYRWQQADGRFAFLADVAPTAHLCNEADWLADLAPFGRYCVETRGECGKGCHGCDGTPCRAVYAWTGQGFSEALFEAEPVRWESAAVGLIRPHRDDVLLATCDSPASR